MLLPGRNETFVNCATLTLTYLLTKGVKTTLRIEIVPTFLKPIIASLLYRLSPSAFAFVVIIGFVVQQQGELSTF